MTKKAVKELYILMQIIKVKFGNMRCTIPISHVREEFCVNPELSQSRKLSWVKTLRCRWHPLDPAGPRWPPLALACINNVIKGRKTCGWALLFGGGLLLCPSKEEARLEHQVMICKPSVNSMLYMSLMQLNFSSKFHYELSVSGLADFCHSLSSVLNLAWVCQTMSTNLPKRLASFYRIIDACNIKLLHVSASHSPNKKNSGFCDKASCM